MNINDDIMKFIRSRQEEGERKYGKTIERDDLKPSAWAQHALEEMADGIQYAARCVDTIARLEYAANEALIELTVQFAKMPDSAEKDRIVGIARKLVVALDGNGQKPFGLPWLEAPEWAMWAAMDSDNLWYWFVGEPSIGKANLAWIVWPKGKYQMFKCDLRPDWTQSKQRRSE